MPLKTPDFAHLIETQKTSREVFKGKFLHALVDEVCSVTDNPDGKRAMLVAVGKAGAAEVHAQINPILGLS